MGKLASSFLRRNCPLDVAINFLLMSYIDLLRNVNKFLFHYHSDTYNIISLEKLNNPSDVAQAPFVVALRTFKRRNAVLHLSHSILSSSYSVLCLSYYIFSILSH